jgi:hypothetical protein
MNVTIQVTYLISGRRFTKFVNIFLTSCLNCEIEERKKLVESLERNSNYYLELFIK